ncbi:TPA: O-antigen polymerase [Vibrio parahaemolyticus]|nr:oligosaccharide repeat unit polymerase [Vibrio parahaemolyticus]
MIRIWTKKNIIFSIFTLIFVLDMYLFGGGRVVEVFGITLRMFLFSFALILAVIFTISRMKISLTVVWVILLFLLVLCYSSFLSAVSNGLSFSSISAYLFVLVILFFYAFSDRVFYFLERTIAFCCLFMSVSYLGFLYLAFSGNVSFLDIYKFLPESELFLRGQDGFVYKGFLYLLIGSLYFIIVDRYKPIWRAIFFILCFSAILATLTRGFVISLLIVVLIYYVVNSKSLALKLTVVSITLFFPIFIFSFYPDLIFRSGSDSTRINDIYVFLNFIDNGRLNLIFGDGISAYLGDRAGVENAYMDTWLRFGLFGVFLLILCFIKITIDYYYLRTNMGVDKRYDWLYYSVVLIFIQSNFNPYVNNYIGGSFLMFVLVFFDKRRTHFRNVSSLDFMGENK